MTICMASCIIGLQLMTLEVFVQQVGVTPSDEEWTILAVYLGGDSVAGGKMKSLTNWTLQYSH